MFSSIVFSIIALFEFVLSCLTCDYFANYTILFPSQLRLFQKHDNRSLFFHSQMVNQFTFVTFFQSRRWYSLFPIFLHDYILYISIPNKKTFKLRKLFYYQIFMFQLLIKHFFTQFLHLDRKLWTPEFWGIVRGRPSRNFGHFLTPPAPIVTLFITNTLVLLSQNPRYPSPKTMTSFMYDPLSKIPVKACFLNNR